MQCSNPGDEIAASADPGILAAENARLVRELAEIRQHQAATGEILDIISRSPADIRPVFDMLAESAARLSQAEDVLIFRRDGERLLTLAHHGPIPYFPVGQFSIPLVRGMPAGRSVLEARIVHVADLQSEK